jgi:glyceraldehyde 3-phosphate dehydrogenase
MAKTLRVGINGMGRIGRTLLREYFQRHLTQIEVVAVNSPGDINVYCHLLNRDSVHGKFDYDAVVEGNSLKINGKTVAFYTCTDPAEIPWEKHQVDFVIDATGKFKDKPGLGKHMRGSVKKVMMCAPGKDLDATFVYGINHETYKPDTHNIMSNASCTTNCLAPVAKILQDNWGIKDGFMTTVHAYTSDQALLDGNHKDIRRARAAALSMIPTSTGAAKSLGVVIPELKGKLDGYAIRVPTPNVSMVDLTVTLEKDASVAAVNQAMKQASEGRLKGVLAYNELPLVSVDFVSSRFSSIFDSTLTNMIGRNLKVVSWYDNEAGFSNRVLDVVSYIGTRW